MNTRTILTHPNNAMPRTNSPTQNNKFYVPSNQNNESQKSLTSIFNFENKEIPTEKYCQ